MRLFAQDLTTDTLQHIAARGLSEAGGPKPLLLRVLVDLYVRRPSHSDDEIQHFAEIAHSILPCATRAEVDHAAMRLCQHPAAPGELMDLLDSRGGEGALLLLEKCRRLSTHVLQNAAAAGPCEAACALATRNDLDAATCALLAARPEPQVALALVKNESAPLPAEYVDQLVIRAQKDDELAKALCHRFPHRPSCTSLFLKAARAERLVMIAATRSRLGEAQAEDEPRRTYNADEDADLCAFEQACGEYAEMASSLFGEMLARKFACPQDLAQAILQDRGGEALILTLRALGADAPKSLRLSALLSKPLSEGHSLWRHALALSISRRVGVEIVQALIGMPGDTSMHQPLHDMSAARNGLRPAPLTTAAEYQLQQNLSA
jgi:Uncharacterised protein conserved in bacteria (DUF2336)